MQFSSKIHCGMENSVDPNQTSPSASYGKCPKILDWIPFLAKILLFIKFFPKIRGGMANSVDPGSTLFAYCYEPGVTRKKLK